MYQLTNQKKILDYESKLMNRDQGHLSVPETDYSNECKTEYPHQGETDYTE